MEPLQTERSPLVNQPSKESPLASLNLSSLKSFRNPQRERSLTSMSETDLRKSDLGQMFDRPTPHSATNPLVERSEPPKREGGGEPSLPSGGQFPRLQQTAGTGSSQGASGNRPQRNNNPLNIKASQHTMSYQGVVGVDPSEASDGGKFLIFDSPQSGFLAATRLLRTENYLGLTVDQAMKRWSNHGYGGEIAPYLKNKIIGSLSAAEMQQLVQSMARHEGFYAQGGAQTQQGSTAGRTHLGVVSTPFGGSTRYEPFHPGVDIANKRGTPVPAFTGGIVVAVEYGKGQGDKGFGNYVIVKDKDGNQHRYSHLEGGFVRVGDQITSGQKIGTMGNTGSVYSESGGDGSHLDYRVVSAYGKYMNPLTYIKNFSS